MARQHWRLAMMAGVFVVFVAGAASNASLSSPPPPAAAVDAEGTVHSVAPAGGATLASGCGLEGAALGNPVHPVIGTFLSRVRADSQLQNELQLSITESKAHGPNSISPWTICDVLACFNAGIYYLGIGEGETPIFLLDDILRGSVWQFNTAAKSFVHDYVVAKGGYYYSKSTAPFVTAVLKANEGLVNLADYEVPLGGWTSIGQFFTRKLAPGRRPVDTTHTYVSPVDCMVQNLLDNAGGKFGNETVPVKGRKPVNMTALLGSDELAAPFIGGQAIFVALGEANYHRWHAPCDANVTRVDILGDMCVRWTSLSVFTRVLVLCVWTSTNMSACHQLHDKVFVFP